MRLFVLLVLTFGLSCKSQSQSSTTEPKQEFEFSGLTFLTSTCNGTCPDISMNLYDDKSIEISRVIYKKKGQVDTTSSGNFKGTLGDKEFNKVVSLLKAINWDSVTFPKVLCCDAPIVTLLFSYKGTYKRFKSMTPPQSTNALFKYLTDLGSKVILPKYDLPIDFENFDL